MNPMWNPSAGDHECNKAGNIDGYLDIENCLCVKRPVLTK